MRTSYSLPFLRADFGIFWNFLTRQFRALHQLIFFFELLFLPQGHFLFRTFSSASTSSLSLFFVKNLKRGCWWGDHSALYFRIDLIWVVSFERVLFFLGIFWIIRIFNYIFFTFVLPQNFFKIGFWTIVFSWESLKFLREIFCLLFFGWEYCSDYQNLSPLFRFKDICWIVWSFTQRP